MDTTPPGYVPSPRSPRGERTDAERAWADCVQWAHRPRDGVVLPMRVAALIAREVMENAVHELLPDASPIEVSAYLQRQARRLALERVANERKRQDDAQLWHDPEWQPDEPLLNLNQLQTDNDEAWLTAVSGLRKLAMPVIRSCGVPADDADDAFSEVLAGLVKPNGDGKRPLDDLLVAEELPALCKVFARRRATDYQRHRSASKRDITLTIALETADALPQGLEASATLTEFDLVDLLELSSHAVSPPQWEIITRLILHQSDTHTTLIADARLMADLAINPQSSEATRRRRLRDALETALERIRRLLDLP